MDTLGDEFGGIPVGVWLLWGVGLRKADYKWKSSSVLIIEWATEYFRTRSSGENGNHFNEIRFQQKRLRLP